MLRADLTTYESGVTLPPIGQSVQLLNSKNPPKPLQRINASIGNIVASRTNQGEIFYFHIWRLCVVELPFP